MEIHQLAFFMQSVLALHNFSQTATEVLNEYFYSRLSNPLPSEEATCKYVSCMYVCVYVCMYVCVPTCVGACVHTIQRALKGATVSVQNLEIRCMHSGGYIHWKSLKILQLLWQCVMHGKVGMSLTTQLACQLLAAPDTDLNRLQLQQSIHL